MFSRQQLNESGWALRPCFERYPNHRLVSLKPYHSEWRMRTEEHCLQFCSDTRSRCRSVVYDSGQHICHFFLDDGYDFTITAAKMIYLRVSSRECLDRISSSSSGANSVDWGSREVVTAPATPTLPPAHFTIPSAPTFSQDEQMEVAEASNEETMTATTDAASDTTTYSASTEELGTELPSATDEQDGIDLEEIGGQNEVLRDVNGIENMEKRWQSSMEQLVKNTEDYAFKGARIRTPVRVEPVSKAATATQSTDFAHMKPQKKQGLLRHKYPAKYDEYLWGKEDAPASIPISVEEELPSAEVIEMITKPAKRGRTKFAGKRITFSDDRIFSRKVEGADIRRQPQRSLKQVSLVGAPKPSYENKARSFLQMVNTKNSHSDKGEKKVIVPVAQLDSSAVINSLSGCSEENVPIWMAFENSVGSEVIDSTFVKDWSACKEICEDEKCKSFTYYDDRQCMVNTEDEGVHLRPPPKGEFTAKTGLKFCYPGNISPYHGCANFNAFRDYALQKEPIEQFDGLPFGYDGLKLCVELCVLSTEFPCKSASFLALEGRCLLHDVDSISAPAFFEPSYVKHQLYFENGCAPKPKLSPIDKTFLSVERVPMRTMPSSLKALQIKPIKLRRRRTIGRRTSTFASVEL